MKLGPCHRTAGAGAVRNSNGMGHPHGSAQQPVNDATAAHFLEHFSAEAWREGLLRGQVRQALGACLSIGFLGHGLIVGLKHTRGVLLVECG